MLTSSYHIFSISLRCASIYANAFSLIPIIFPPHLNNKVVFTCCGKYHFKINSVFYFFTTLIKISEFHNSARSFCTTILNFSIFLFIYIVLLIILLQKCFFYAGFCTPMLCYYYCKLCY